MSGWLQRVSGLFAGRAAASRTLSSTTVPAEDFEPIAAAAEAPAAVDAAELQQPFFDWVIGAGAALQTPLDARERRLLANLDSALESRETCAAQLPRAPSVIPQLLNSLRDEGQSTGALAGHVIRDPHLVAEVIRMANAAQTRATDPIVDIAEAIGRLGTNGLRRAIARVVLKPMFVGAPKTLSARCAQRLWQHSESKAGACQEEARRRGLDPFEGYLTGLMHNIGWTAALRVIDGSQGGAPSQFTRDFAAAFEPRRDTFFAMLVTTWELTPGVTALGDELLASGLAGARSPLGEALRAAEARASVEMLGASGLVRLHEDASTH